MIMNIIAGKYPAERPVYHPNFFNSNVLNP